MVKMPRISPDEDIYEFDKLHGNTTDHVGHASRPVYRQRARQDGVKLPPVLVGQSRAQPAFLKPKDVGTTGVTKEFDWHRERAKLKGPRQSQKEAPANHKSVWTEQHRHRTFHNMELAGDTSYLANNQDSRKRGGVHRVAMASPLPASGIQGHMAYQHLPAPPAGRPVNDQSFNKSRRRVRPLNQESGAGSRTPTLPPLADFMADFDRAVGEAINMEQKIADRKERAKIPMRRQERVNVTDEDVDDLLNELDSLM